METKARPQVKHIGRNIGRIRELLGIKQEAVADALGISQQAVSKIEQSESVEEVTIDRVAKVLGVNSESIKNFNEEAVINIIANTITNHDQAAVVNYNPTFNPVEKWIEAIEENKKLYQALLKSEREKVAILEKMVKGKKK
jgi:transcriptional regulator with XRE-family HTH domain